MFLKFEKGKIHGKGSDIIGRFKIIGQYKNGLERKGYYASLSNIISFFICRKVISDHRIIMKKKYIINTGDNKNNYGQEVIIKMKFEPQKQAFFGNYSVNHPKIKQNGYYMMSFKPNKY